MLTKKIIRRALSVLMVLTMALSLIPGSALAAYELENQDQVDLESAGTFTIDEMGYYGIPVDGHDFVAIKQGTWSLIWTPEALNDDDKTALESAITNSTVQLSPGNGTFYFFDGLDSEYTVSEKNGATYSVEEIDGVYYLLAPQNKISHFYYGDYKGATPPAETGSLEITKTVEGLEGTDALPGDYSVAVTVSENGDAVGTVSFTGSDIADGNAKAINGVPVGEHTYTVEETVTGTGVSGGQLVIGSSTYTMSSDISDNGYAVNIGTEDAARIGITNTYTKSVTPTDPGDDDDPTPPPTSTTTDIPDENTPLAPQPDPAQPAETEIVEDEVPLAPQPAEAEEVPIVEEAVPMGNLPQTGSVPGQAVDPSTTLGLLAFSLSLAAAGLAILIGRKKKDETRSED